MRINQTGEYHYPAGYNPAPIKDQIRELAKSWKLRGREAQETANRLLDQRLPAGADGLYAFVASDESSYANAVAKLIKKLGKRLGAHNTLSASLRNIELRRHRKTTDLLCRLAEEQRSDIIVLPAQTGELYSGIPTSEARAMFARNEFGLGILEVGSILFACPGRLQTMRDLFPDCPADEIRPDRQRVIRATPCFSINMRGDLMLDSHADSSASRHYGASTAFSVPIKS